MCKLLIGIKNKKQNNDFDTLLKIQEEEIVKEPDGMGAIVLKHDNSLIIFRELEEYSEVLKKVYALKNDAKMIILHSRQGTSGARDLTNVHCFEDENYLFAHNGFVSQYFSKKTWDTTIFPKQTPTPPEEIAQIITIVNSCHNCGYFSESGFSQWKKCKKHKKENGLLREYENKLKGNDSQLCDSFQFLKKLSKSNISPQYLSDQMTEQGFTGMAFLINKITKKAYLLLRNKDNAYAITDKENFSMFFSYQPEKKSSMKLYSWINGIPISSGEKEIKIDLKSNKIINGVHEFDFDTLLNSEELPEEESLNSSKTDDEDDNIEDGTTALITL